jgi:hypothetical protein
MTRIPKILLLFTVFSFLLTASAYAKPSLISSNPFLGTWKLIAITRDTIPSGTKTYPFGVNPKGYIHYSHDGRMMVIIAKDNRPNPKDAAIKSQDAEALFKSMNSYAGTYEVKNDCIIHHIDISWNQKWTGTDQVRYYKFNGNKLVLSIPAKLDPQTKKLVVDSLFWEKLQSSS